MGLPYRVVELFYIGMPVVLMDGRSGVRSRDYKISRIGRLPHFRRYGATLARAWSSAINLIIGNKRSNANLQNSS